MLWKQGRLSIMEYLIAKGFDITRKYSFKHETIKVSIEAAPVVFAGVRGLPDVFSFLLKKGADPLASDVTFRRTALHWAAMLGWYDFFEGIIETHRRAGRKRRDW